MVTKNIVAASIVGVAAVSFIGWQVLNNKDDNKKGPSSPVSPITSGSGSYKDGKYSAEGTYMAPPGQETIQLSLDIANNKIVAATVSPTNISQNSQFYFDLFQKGFSSEVVGKNIDEVKLSVVNGSSLTPNGFNQALETIKTQAKN